MNPSSTHEDRLEVVLGDITEQAVDAVVNAANRSLEGGGGVDGAIRRKAGSGLAEECRRLGGCPTGEARITGGYDLLARHVIHTVGPIWWGLPVAFVQRLLGHSPDKMLARCYRACFVLVEEHELRTVAFPSIITGVYNFPVRRAARIAVTEIRSFLARKDRVEKVLVVCVEKRVYDAYLRALEKAL